ncbi:MAG: hypothetical protein AB2797_04565, partial [Candidatus Thiodiazotropha sp.]
ATLLGCVAFLIWRFFVSQLDYTVLFIFPVFYGAIALMIFISPSSSVDAAQLPPEHLPELLNSALSFLNSTAIVVGGLAIAQLAGCFYLVNRIRKLRNG